METKICSKCKEGKTVDLFGKNKTSAGGFRADCKSCVAQVLKIWREKHKETLKIRKAKYYQDNIEEIKKKNHQYSKEHSKEAVERVKRWALANPEKVKTNRKRTKQNRKEQIKAYNALPHVKEHARLSSRKQRLTHPERIKATQANYVANHQEKLKEKHLRESILYKERNHERYALDKEKNPEKYKSRARIYYYGNKDKYTTNRHNRRLRLNGNGGKHSNKEWVELKQKYGFTCLKCGKKEPEIKLTVDHVFPIKWGGTNNIANIQCLCRPCNCGKNKRYGDYRPDSPNYGVGWKKPSLWG